ncbi:hypothetical protein CAPTEDRAFT_219714 [Capitella teleta]|uniref:Uncharacterized protein n=1 Tax=Capitella teleta TaxID=283909 RepID=R7UBI4_CAPTE|nr:hypothetical protein CAPTEDRAFT_219714 [Capitella teleta]|eukprot:ELU01168.1 hypothetical protein CAPTEDRAFT_219714 [Capitella teleta]
MDDLYTKVLSAYERSSPVLAVVGLAIVLYHGLRWLGSAFTMFRAFVAPRFVGPVVNFKQMGEWAAITGATDGIGKCYAEQLAEKGMNIILLSRNPDKLKRVATEIEERFRVKTKIVPFNFTNPLQKYEALKTTLAGYDIGVLVNNVGISHPSLPLLYVKDQVIEDMIACNIRGAIQMTKFVLPGMVEKGRGVIINNASMLGTMPLPYLSTYSGTKACLDFFTRGLQNEFGQKGIIIQSLLPFWVITNMVPKDWKPTFFTPLADDYVRAALGTVGVLDRTTGYFPHTIQRWLFSKLSDYQHYMIMKKALEEARDKNVKDLENPNTQAPAFSNSVTKS